MKNLLLAGMSGWLAVMQTCRAKESPEDYVNPLIGTAQSRWYYGRP